MARLSRWDVREIVREEIRAAFNLEREYQSDPDVILTWQTIKDLPATTGARMVKDVLDSYRELKNNEKENN